MSPLSLEVRPHPFDRVELRSGWRQRLEFDTHPVCKVNRLHGSVCSVVVKNHNAVILLNLVLNMREELLEVGNVSLVC